MSRTLIFLAPDFPNPVCSLLSEKGYRMFEAHSAAEAESLAKDHDVDALVVAGESSDLRLQELRRHLITIDLAAHATGSEVYFELSHLFSVNLSFQ